MQFRNLNEQYDRIKDKINAGIHEVISGSNFISGSKVKELEEKLAEYVGVKHCITCANGTDAITIGLKAMLSDLSSADLLKAAVFAPDFTFFSTGECPASLGLPTYFVDVKSETYNINPDALKKTVEQVISEGKHIPKVVIAVDLFGQPAEYDKLRKICDKYDMYLFEDGAQGFGGAILDSAGQRKMACSLSDIASTSFFPAKPLGCYGDGGAIFTDNDEWATMIRSICVHGRDMSDPDDPDAKYNNVRLGYNSRLDTIQAAVLLAKFDQFKDYELVAVNEVAGWYNEFLADTNLKLPVINSGYFSSWAQYTVQLPSDVDRGEIQNKMKESGVPTMVYYRKPMHQQGAFAGTISAKANCPVTEELCKNVLCLPIHPYLKKDVVKMVCGKLKEAVYGTR